MEVKQKLLKKMALSLFCLLSMPAYSANRGFVNGDFHSYFARANNQTFIQSGEHGWKSTEAQGIEIWNNYLGVTGAKNANAGVD